MSAAERHNRLAREFAMKAGHETDSSGELMVVLESTIFASMLLLHKLYGVSPAASVEMVESAIHRATERFADDRGRP